MLPAAPPLTIATTFDTLLAAGELVDELEFCERSRLTPTQLTAALTAGRVFRLEAGAARGYPAFLLDHELDRNQVETVSELLGESSPGSKFAFFTTPRGSLATPGPMAGDVRVGTGTPRTPLQALRDGDFGPVKQAALSSNGR